MIYRDKLLQISQKLSGGNYIFSCQKKYFPKQVYVFQRCRTNHNYVTLRRKIYCIQLFTYVEKNATGPHFNIIQKARRLMNDSYVGDYLVFKRGRKKSNGAILFIIDSNDLKIRFSNGPPPPLALPLSYYDFNYRQRATTHSIEVYLSTNIVSVRKNSSILSQNVKFCPFTNTVLVVEYSELSGYFLSFIHRMCCCCCQFALQLFFGMAMHCMQMILGFEKMYLCIK